MKSPTVFISYTHDSPEHADRVLALADRLINEGVNCILDQYEKSPPEGWPMWMDRHIKNSEFVIMICTETYYRRVMGEEEPGTGLGVKWEGKLIYQHIYKTDAKNTRFIPVLFKTGKVEHIPTPLQDATHYGVDTAQGYEDLYRRLTDQPRTKKPKLGKLKKLPQRERKQDFLETEITGPEKISLAKLPSTSPDLFGREKELAMLNVAWKDTKTNVLSLVAWGGVGKTALVNKWLLQMGQEDYRGAERVFGWSFYSQGAKEGGQASADQFIAAALEWFGDPEMAKSSKFPWDKGERLAELVKEQQTLLILDGLEPLQYPPGEMEGRLKDPGLCCLLRELAHHNPGLCIITTRLKADDLKDFFGSSVDSIDLENLSTEDGAAYLAHLGVIDTPEELKQAVGEFEGHALALTLLGSYISVVYKGDIRQRDKIAKLAKEKKQGAHAIRVMKSYERWFKDKPGLNILLMMGLFDRPAEGGAIEALKTEPAIKGLTSELQGLSHEDWQFAVDNLRTARLLAEEEPHSPGTLDCHPLIREHFGEKLKQSNPKAWKEAHSRLYEYYKSQAKEFPDTIEEMVPLYAAVAHGCQAGRYKEALDEVYVQRIQRGKVFFSSGKLGLFGADLAVLSAFFNPPWQKPVAVLNSGRKAFLLNQAGIRLQALGQLREAIQPLQAAFEAHIKLGNWYNAARSASNLSLLYLPSGNLFQAMDFAQKNVDFANFSNDTFIKMANQAIRAHILHQMGYLREAEAIFHEAIKIQKERQPQHPFLYSIIGFFYCDLLLNQGEFEEVQSCASQALNLANQQGFLLDIALDHLSLGRAHLLQAQQEETSDPSVPSAALRTSFTQAAAHLDQAVDGLRKAGTQHHVPSGLLARGELYRFMKDFKKAQHDLDEAITIATRGGMRLHEADCHLEYARLYLAMGEKEKARESLVKAKEMIEAMGYHRRDKEIKELEKQLKKK